VRKPYRIKMNSHVVEVWLERRFDISGSVDSPSVWFRGLDVTHLMTRAEMDELRQVMCEERIGLIEDNEESA
jgi:hypothetical protein